MSEEWDRGFSEETLKVRNGRKTIMIDETGDEGLDSDPPRYGIAAAITEQPEAIAEIAREKREELGDSELKYRTALPETRAYMSEELAKTDVKVVGTYIDKKALDNPRWWYRKKNRSYVHRNLLSEFAEDLMDEDIDGARVILDNHTAIKSKVGKRTIEGAAADRRDLGIVTQEDSLDGVNKDFMQGADFAIAEYKKTIAGKEPAIPVKSKRITEKNRRKK